MTEATLQVQVDKSHITTIGEKLYGESLELIRELVSNAYDADATRVWIELGEKGMKVADDGSGMDESGLREYFNIGSQNKRFANITRKYGRARIGQFGIGKFAVLSACDRFRVYTQKAGYAAEVTFDKELWRNSDQWRVPIQKVEYSPAMGDGTVIKLEAMRREFTIPEVERFIRERLPLSAPHFAVYVNGKKTEPVYIAGPRFPIALQTPYGPIVGEAIAPNFKNRLPDALVGIECTVNGVVISRERFGLESQSLFAVHKLTGRIAADFLPITSDRSRFIQDSEEYCLFVMRMETELKKVARLLGEETVRKSKEKADETLKDTMSRLGKAIRRNPTISPRVMLPTGEIDPTGAEHPNSMAPEATTDETGTLEVTQITIREKTPQESGDKTPAPDDTTAAKAQKIKVRSLAGKMMVARRIRVGDLGIVCNIDSYGKDDKPVFTEGGVIYINQDHALYKKQEKKGRESLSFYLGYLLSQQIALMFVESDPQKAFEIQNKLLTDSF